MIQIITNEGCVKCNMAKALLASKGIDFNEIRMGEDITREDIISTYPSARTFPVISVNGNYIGGYTELLQKITEEGENFGKLLIKG